MSEADKTARRLDRLDTAVRRAELAIDVALSRLEKAQADRARALSALAETRRELLAALEDDS